MKKNSILIILLILLPFGWLFLSSFSKSAMKKYKYIDDNDKQERFIAYLLPFVKKLSKKYKLPYRGIIAQMALETGWGKSTLMTKYNNFGGIKAPNGIQLQTYEFLNGVNVQITDGFATWKTPFEGLEGYFKLIALNPRYADALNYQWDSKGYIQTIYDAGYATGENYVSTVWSILDNYKEELNA